MVIAGNKQCLRRVSYSILIAWLSKEGKCQDKSHLENINIRISVFDKNISYGS